MTASLDLPSNRTEGWRWSDLSALPDFTAREPGGLVRPLRDLWIESFRDGPRLLFVDGALVSEQSNLGTIEIGAVEPEPRDHALARLVGPEGWKLRLGRDHAAQGIVQIVHATTGAADHLPAQIELDVDAQASIVETFVGHGWTNRLSHFRLFRGARLMLSRRLLGTSGFVSLTDRVEVGEGASFVAATLAAGGADTRLDGDIRMAGTSAYAEAAGALLARGTQRHDANLVIHHAMPNGSSRQLWRSVADDVKCAHGATVGELDRNALFYLASRGVPEDEAKGLLTRAFVADAIERIGEPAVKEAFYADVEDWFSQAPLPSGEREGPISHSEATADGRVRV